MMERFEVCPQPIWVFDAPKDVLEESLALVESDPQYRLPRPQDSPATARRTRTTNSQLHQLEETKLTSAWISRCVNEVKEEYNMPYERLSITELWIVKSRSGAKLEPHTHGLSVMSGVFYLSEGIGTTFEKLDMFVTVPFGIRGDRSVKTIFPSEPGKLVVFPSNIRHGFAPITLPETQEARYTMAFNTCMDGKCGYLGGRGYANITVS